MKRNTSLVFTGDIGFDRYMDKKWEDSELISNEILDFLHSGDHVIANVEGPIIEQVTNTKSDGVVQLLHSMNPGAVKVLNNMKADIWNICNNHIMDAGEEGLISTINIAKENHAQTLGAGKDIYEARKPLTLDEAGGIGMIGVGYQRACRAAGEDKGGCFSWSDLDAIEKAIIDIKSKCRWCIVVAHAGEEFTSLPHPYTRERYIKYLEMGADFVVAHHPHVPMNYEKIGDKIIFYSLGNFIFDTDYQRVQLNTELGVLVKLNLSENGYSFESMGLKIDREKDHIIANDLPRIFTNVSEEEYKRLIPLSAKAFIESTKKQWTYLKPDKFKNATEEIWMDDFANPLRSGRVPGETLDFSLIVPLSKEENNKAWMDSKLEAVKEYILEQL